MKKVYHCISKTDDKHKKSLQRMIEKVFLMEALLFKSPQHEVTLYIYKVIYYTREYDEYKL